MLNSTEFFYSVTAQIHFFVSNINLCHIEADFTNNGFDADAIDYIFQDLLNLRRLRPSPVVSGPLDDDAVDQLFVDARRFCRVVDVAVAVVSRLHASGQPPPQPVEVLPNPESGSQGSSHSRFGAIKS